MDSSATNLPSHPLQILSSVHSNPPLSDRYSEDTSEMPFPRTPSPHAMLLKSGPFDSPFSDFTTDTSFSPECDTDTRKARERFVHSSYGRNNRLQLSTLDGPSAMQLDLLWRLHQIGKLVTKTDLTAEQARSLDERFDTIEAYLVAPDIQTRQPPELEDSGLFMDDEDEVEYIKKDRTAGLGLGKDATEVFEGTGKSRETIVKPKAPRRRSSHFKSPPFTAISEDAIDPKLRIGAADVLASSVKNSEDPTEDHSMTAGRVEEGPNGEMKWEEDTTLVNTDGGGFEKDVRTVEPATEEPADSAVGFHSPEPEKKAHIDPPRVHLPEIGYEAIVSDMAAQFQNATDQLQERFAEVKYLNSLMLDRIDSAAAENQSLKSAHDKLLLTLHLDYSELLFLKVQLQGLEALALPNNESSSSATHAMERLELDWRDIEQRFSQRIRSHEQDRPATKMLEGVPDDLKEQLTKAQEGLEQRLDLSEQTRGRVRQLAPESMSSVRAVSDDLREALAISMDRGFLDHSDTATPTVEEPAAPAIEEGQQQSPKRKIKRKVRIVKRRSFWDSLAEAVGIIDYYDMFAPDD